jgi:hypothetical protein
MPPRTPRIEVLSARDRFYIGDDLDDGRGIRIKSTKFQVDKGVFMSTASTFALALTERCCEVGKGKVRMTNALTADRPFLISNSQKVLCNLRQDLTGKDLPPHLIAANNALPDLVYFPILWRKSQQYEYKSLKHHTRLNLLDALTHFLSSTTLVLPIQLIVQPNSNANASPALEKDISIGISPNTDAAVTMLHSPETYLGYTHDFPLITEAEAGVADTAQQAPSVIGLSDPALQTLRYRSGDMLVKRFDEMYTMGIESLVQGGTLQNPYDILKEVNAVAGAIRRFEDEKGGVGGGEGVPGGLLGEYIL